MFLRLVFSVLLVLVALPTAYACRYGYGGYSGYSRYGSYGGYGGDTAVTEGTAAISGTEPLRTLAVTFSALLSCTPRKLYLFD
ncbi:hypothetical protein QR680_003613 [Steinernema hermaphroditum]|uniref:Uncharacterized protein n=1 Tax=Steinernema hermaphroditum TaxID=289476 RepID=A0AA39HN67_9BILA|nr:hypothetical protein QR680_003613 [Steinernema hermaphroditum]